MLASNIERTFTRTTLCLSPPKHKKKSTKRKKCFPMKCGSPRYYNNKSRGVVVVPLERIIILFMIIMVSSSSSSFFSSLLWGRSQKVRHYHHGFGMAFPFSSVRRPMKSFSIRKSPFTHRRYLASTTTSTSSAEPFYITTPIYYVNDKPHIGHAYTSTGTSKRLYLGTGSERISKQTFIFF